MDKTRVATFRVIGGHPKLQGEFLMVVRYPQLDLYEWKKQDVLVESFHIPHLRAYGQSGRDFAFEAGRRCPLGVGSFPFKVATKENISKTIDKQLKVSKEDNGNIQDNADDGDEKTKKGFVTLGGGCDGDVDVDAMTLNDENARQEENQSTTTKLKYVQVSPGGPISMKPPETTTPYTQIDIQKTVAAAKMFEAPASSRGTRVIGRHAAKVQSNNSSSSSKKSETTTRNRKDSTSSVSSRTSVTSHTPRQDTEIDRQLRALYLDVKVEAEGGDPNAKPMLVKRQISEPIPSSNTGRRYSNVSVGGSPGQRRYSNVSVSESPSQRRYSNVSAGQEQRRYTNISLTNTAQDNAGTSSKRAYVNLPNDDSDQNDDVDLDDMLSSLEDKIAHRDSKAKPSRSSPLKKPHAVYLRALYDNVGQVEHELSFSRGNSLVLLCDNFKGNTDWMLCELYQSDKTVKGYVPANYVSKI